MRAGFLAWTRKPMRVTAPFLKKHLQRDIYFYGVRLWPFRWIAIGVLTAPRTKQEENQ